MKFISGNKTANMNQEKIWRKNEINFSSVLKAYGPILSLLSLLKSTFPSAIFDQIFNWFGEKKLIKKHFL